MTKPDDCDPYGELWTALTVAYMPGFKLRVPGTGAILAVIDSRDLGRMIEGRLGERVEGKTFLLDDYAQCRLAAQVYFGLELDPTQHTRWREKPPPAIEYRQLAAV